MMRILLWCLAVVLAGLALAACGSSATSVGCEWFEGDNCWKDMFTHAEACAHPREEPATLASDGKSCSFTDGTEVLLENPVLPAELDRPDG